MAGSVNEASYRLTKGVRHNYNTEAPRQSASIEITEVADAPSSDFARAAHQLHHQSQPQRR